MNIRHYITALLLLFGCIISLSAAAVPNVSSVVRQDGAVVESTDYYPYGTPLTTAGAVQPYKYGAKELDRMHGLDLYDSQARWYDSLLGRTSTLDPQAEKYYSFSPYTWCAGNPVRFVDPDGCEPTIDEAAAIAAHVYGDQPNEILGEWEVVPDDEKNKYRLNTNTGLKSNLYRKALAEGGYEYVYATAGTDKDDIKDWLANLSQLSGLSAQYHDSANNAKMISEDYKESELTFVGHSLGGGQAALNSLVTSSNTLKGRNAITFNASGVSALTKLKEGGIKALLKLETKIRAYITISDPLNLIQNSVSFIGKLMPDVNGTRHYVLPQMLDGHSIENFK